MSSPTATSQRRRIQAIIRRVAAVHNHRALGLALLLAAAWKAALVAGGAFPFNSDEAVVGLMARHILRGERPLFFYGQAYMGSLDAYLVAGGFALLGEHVWVIRAVQTLLYLGVIALVYCLCVAGFRSKKVATFAAFLLALPSVNTTLYTTVSLGDYGEALVLGVLLLLLTLQMREAPHRVPLALAIGILAGLGLWVFPLALVFAVPAGIGAIVSSRTGARRNAAAGAAAAALLAGAVVGAGPWLYAFTRIGGAALSELAGSAVSGATAATLPAALAARTLNLLLFGSTVILGLRPPWSTDMLASPLAPIAFAFGIGLIVFSVLELRNRDGARGTRWLLFGSALMLCAAFLFSPFGADPSGRYFLPLAIWMSVAGAELLEWLRAEGGRIACALAALVLCFNAVSTLQAAAKNPPGITTQFDEVTQVDTRSLPELAAFLRSSGETRGYTNYWVEYPLAFLTGEDLIFVARLPYHLDMRYTPRDDRYPPYDQRVESSQQVAYVTTKHPALDALIREELKALQVSFAERQFGDYHLFYALSRPVRPEELGLGQAR